MRRFYPKLIIGIAIAGTIVVGCLVFLNKHKPAATQSESPVPAAMRLALGIGEVDGSKVDESYIDSRVKPGMLVKDVEGLLGKPYMTVPFMGTERASYKITPAPSGIRPLSGFAVVYEAGKVKHVDKSFAGP